MRMLSRANLTTLAVDANLLCTEVIYSPSVIIHAVAYSIMMNKKKEEEKIFTFRETSHNDSEFDICIYLYCQDYASK